MGLFPRGKGALGGAAKLRFAWSPSLLGFFLAAGSWVAAGAPPDDSPAELELTVEERAWLDSHRPIRIGNHPDFAPIDLDDERGMPAGVAADVMALVQKKLGLKLEYVPGQTWDEAFAAVRDGTSDVLLQAGRSPEREHLFLFTQP